MKLTAKHLALKRGGACSPLCWRQDAACLEGATEVVRVTAVMGVGITRARSSTIASTPDAGPSRGAGEFGVFWAVRWAELGSGVLWPQSLAEYCCVRR